MIHLVYRSLATLIASAPGVAGVEWYVRQDELGEPVVRQDRYVYVEFAPVTWQSGGGNAATQYADLRITLHVVTSNRLSTRDQFTVAALARTALVDAVYRRVHGRGLSIEIDAEVGEAPVTFALTNCLVRTAQTYAHTHGKLTTDTISFECRVTDNTALAAVIAALSVAPQIEIETTLDSPIR